jgi:hypothetical protein
MEKSSKVRELSNIAEHRYHKQNAINIGCRFPGEGIVNGAENVQFRDLTDVDLKLQKLQADGKDNLQIIIDFDHTMTRYNVGGTHVKSTWCVLEDGPFAKPEIQAKCAANVAKFSVVEHDPTATPE